jgi:hypothetical protein
VTDRTAPARVWYVAYGSNLSLPRFRCYLAGGRPEGGLRDYPGCRETGDPQAVEAVQIPGGVYFSGRSGTWGGGTASLDPDAHGTVYARAYLLTHAQLSDVVAQEMCRTPGIDLDLSHVTRRGRHVFGAGRYETLVLVGALAGWPMITFTIDSHASLPLAPPVAAYLQAMGRGLREAHSWPADRAGRYLSSLPGASGFWTPEQVETLVQ